MTQHSRIILCSSLLTLCIAGCDTLEQTGAFRLRGSSGEKIWLVPDQENVGAGPARLGDLAGGATEVGYAIGTQRTAYLFGGDLAAGIENGPFHTLPAYDSSSGSIVVEDDIPWMVAEVGPPQTWNSFRVYDSGECSILLDFQEELFPGLVPAFAPTLTSEIDQVFAQCDRHENERFERVSEATVTPVLRARAGGGAGALGIDTDRIRYEARYRAPSVGGCAPVNLDVRFELGLEPAPGGGVQGVVENVWAEVAGFCIVEGTIEDRIVEKITEAAPSALSNAIRDRLLLDPRQLGIDEGSIATCAQDNECATAWPWGSNHRCHVQDGEERGECWIQVDVDRANVRPEGLELVLFEDDTDPQRSLLTDTPSGELLEFLACGPDRWSGILHPIDDVTGTLGPIAISTDSAFDPAACD